MIISRDEVTITKDKVSRTLEAGSQLKNFPYKDLTSHELAQVYAFVLTEYGTGMLLNLVIDEFDKRDNDMSPVYDDEEKEDETVS